MQTCRNSPLARAALFAAKLYRNYLSNNMLHSCRFFPSCSAYAEEAIGCYGAFRGVGRAALRILRCHPFSRGGFDPVA